MNDSPILFFDGVCNLCNSSVNFVIDHDPKGAVHFAALQSDVAREKLSAHGISAGQGGDYDSMVLLDGGRVYVRSSAALQLAKYLSFPWSIARVFLIVPRPIRDFVYGIVAKNRYAWFGKSDTCRVPTPELKARFL